MQALPFFEVFSHVIVVDFLRYFVAASLAYLVFWVVFIRQFEHRIIQRKSPKAKKMWMEFRYSLSTVVIFSLIGSGIVLAQKAGYTQIYQDVSEYGWVWFFASFFILTLIHDAYFYWAHRLMHHPKIFKHVHLVHHRSTNPSPWAAYSFHPIEAVVEAGIFPIIVFMMPVHSYALLAFLIYMITRNVLGHLGIEFLPKWFLKIPFLNLHTTTTHHDLHHKNFDTNYGLYFTWWDRWFGTEDKKYIATFEEVTTRGKDKRNVSEKTESDQKFEEMGITFLSTMVILLFSINVNAQSVAGTWQTFHEGSGMALSQITIEEQRGRIEGRIEKIFLQPWEGENPICAKCPGERKGKPVIGMTFMWDLKKSNNDPHDNQWSRGQILDPASGEVYDSKLWLESSNVLKVRGYAGPMGLIYRTQTWHLEKNGNSKNPVVGTWRTIDDATGKVKSLVEITEQNGRLSGKILKIFLMPWEGENPICLECPGKLKDQKMLGMTILSDFKKEGKEWTDGKIMDPGNGKTYTCTIWLEGENTLHVRGYWGPFYRTQLWRRVEATVKRNLSKSF